MYVWVILLSHCLTCLLEANSASYKVLEPGYRKLRSFLASN
jgi:hypothetical protein